MKKTELFKTYAELDRKPECICLFIHMPTGETEIITNPNVDAKMAYIDKTYNDDLVHNNCKDIYIEQAGFTMSDDTMDFGCAIENMKSGCKVARKGWNGKGMYLRYVDPYMDKAYKITEQEPIDGTLLPYIGMKTADNGFVPWLASQTDMLADDWVIVGYPEEDSEEAPDAELGGLDVGDGQITN